MNAITGFNTLYGEFNSQGIFIDMENNIEEWNVFSTSIHELTHSFIEFDSYLGQLEFLLQQIVISPDTNNVTREKFKDFIKIIYDNSINVQESLAVFWELSFLETYNPDLMDKELETYKTKRPDYYIKYHFIDIQDFLDDAFDRYKFQPTDEQIINKASNLLLLAKYCMNIDITKLTIMGAAALSEIYSDKASFNPNYRFDSAIKYIKEHNISAYNLSKSEIENIFKILEFSHLGDFDILFMTQWANSTFLKAYYLNDYSYYVAYKEDIDELETLLSINCYVSNYKYLGQIVTNPSKSDIMYAAFYAYICDNNDSPSQVALINVIDGKITYINNSYNSNTAIQVGKLFTDRYSYPILYKQNPPPAKIQIYVDLGNWSFIAYEFLQNQRLDGYTCYELNDNFSIILFKGVSKTTFFIALPTINLPLFEAYYLEKINLLDDWWQSPNDLLELCSFVMKTTKSHTNIDF